MRHIAKYYSMQPLVHAVVSAVFCYAFFNASNSVVLAGPEGAEVINGRVSFQRNGLNTVITASDKSIVNYKSFNIARPEAVEFVQPHSNASVLNRILSANPTHINGTLSANGRVFFVNPAGVYIGNGAKINVNQLVASGLNISNSDFISGKYLFTGGHGSVVNRGDITAEKVHLIGKHVANYGTINCPGGYVVMAVGDRVFLGTPGNDLTVEVDTDPLSEPTNLDVGVRNEGTINAEGGEIVLAAAGDIYSQAISNVGTLSASVRAGDAGKVKLIAENGKVFNGGSITATSNSGRGGTVIAEGGEVINSGTVDVTGSEGGQVTMRGTRVGQFGTIHADGTHAHGGNVTLTADEVVALGSDSLTTANAGPNGNGGDITASSPDTALFRTDAKIEAKSGALSGNGGSVEVSGKKHVEISGVVDAGAANGAAGTFLIDPTEIMIVGSDDTQVPDLTDPQDDDPRLFQANANTNEITDETIETLLNNGTSVTLDTSNSDGGGTGLDGAYEGSGDIIQEADAMIDFTGTEGSVTLELIAERDITLNGGIESSDESSGTLGVTLTAQQNITVSADVTTKGGDFTSSGVDFDNTDGVISTNEGAIAINHTGTVTLGADLDPGVGNSPTGTSTLINVSSEAAQIQDAIDIAATDRDNGKTITVSGGTYKENLSVNKSRIELKSSKDEKVTLTAENGVVLDIDGDADEFVLGGAENEGFTIESDTGKTSLVQLRNSPDDVEISWNNLNSSGSALGGILVDNAGSDGLTITNNIFNADNRDYGIWGTNSSNMTITDNKFEPSTDLTMASCAIRFDGVTTLSKISRNKILNWGQGISIYNSGGVNGLVIEDNMITDYLWTGISFEQYNATGGLNGNISDVDIQNNVVTGGTYGILLRADDPYIITNSIAINNNNLSGNVFGINNEMSNGSPLDATSNWWGDTTGPKHITNPGGLGSGASDNVDYSPWLALENDSSEELGFQPVSPMTWGMLQSVDKSAFEKWIGLAESGDTLELNYSGSPTIPLIDDHGKGVNIDIGADGILTVSQKITVAGTVSFSGDGPDGSTGLIINGSIDPKSIDLFSYDDVTINGVLEADEYITVRAGFDGTGNIIWSSGSLETFNSGGYIEMTAGIDGGTSGDIAVGGNVTTNAGNITIKAHDGAITMTDAGVLDAGGGMINIAADGDIKLGRLVTANTSDTAIEIESTSGKIIDNGDTHGADVEAPYGWLVMNAAAGIGSEIVTNVNDSAIETKVASLEISNSKSGNVLIDETDGVDIALVNAGSGDVTITAGGAIRDADLDDTGTPSVDVVGATINLTAGSGGIGTPVVAQAENRVLEVTASTALNADTTADGANINIDSIGDLPVGLISANHVGDISDPADDKYGDVTLNSTGNIESTANDEAVDIIGSTIRLKSKVGGIGTNSAVDVTALRALNADTTGDGADINIDSIGDLPVGLISSDDGAGTIGDVTLKSTGSINDASDDIDVDITGAAVTLTAVDEISGNADVQNFDTAGVLEVTSGSLDISTTGTTVDGAAIVIGDLGGTYLKDIDTAASDITITSDGDLTVGNVHAGTTTTKGVGITADGSINDNEDDTILTVADIVGDTIDLTAKRGGIGTLAVGSVLKVTASTALNADTTADGANINIDSIGDLPVGLVNARKDAGAVGDVTLKSTGSINETGSGDAIVDIMGEVLTLTARDEIGGSGELDIETDITSLEAHSTTAGDIVIVEKDTATLDLITLTEVDTVDGSIDITVEAASGAVGDTVLTAVDAGGDGDEDDVDITAVAGDIVVGTVFAAGSGDVTITASAGSINEAEAGDAEVDIRADVLTLTARDEIGGSDELDIETTVTSLDASSTTAGDIVITETDDVILQGITARNGSIDLIAANGSMSGGMVSASGTADLRAGGSITGTSVTAGPSAVLTAGGDISSVDVGAGFVVLDAGGSIDAGTTADSLMATAVGDIEINEADDVILQGITARNGSIDLKAANGSMSGGMVSASDTADLLAGGSITGTSVIAGPSAVLTAGGDISSVDVGAGFVVLDAGGSIDAGTTADSLMATAGGDIEINEADDVTLTDVDTVDGAITINTGGATIVKEVGTSGGGDEDDVTIIASTGDITLGTVSAAGSGDVTITATAGSINDASDDVVVDITADVLTLTAQDEIGGNPTEGKEVDALGALETIVATLDAHSRGGDIVIVETDDVELQNILADVGSIFLEATDGEMTHQADKTITAGGGSLTMKQADTLDIGNFTFEKQSETDITLESFNGSISVVDAANDGKDDNAADQWKSIKATAQSGIELEGSESITTNALQSTTENISVYSTGGNLIVNGTVKADGGGVELIADAGIIYTEGGSNDTLNVGVIGFSDGNKGVKLPHGDGKAAIVIRSKGDLKLGPGATLTAKGAYKAYDPAHDDRGSVDFQNTGDKAGDPIDVAIYVGSYDFESETGSDVIVNSTVSMTSNGTMVIDAGNVVNSFGNKFTESPVWKNKTSRLEVVSRTTQTVDQAVDKKTLPHAVEARGDEAPSWFQGEQYVLRGKPVAEVLAKVGPVPLVPPLPTELEARSDVEESDTEELMLWLEQEGIAPYLAEADPRTLSTDIRLIKAAKRLRDSAEILKNTTSDQIDILARILDRNMQSSIHVTRIDERHIKVWHRDDAVMAVLNGEWVRALVCYVQTCTDEFYMPYGLAVNLCTGNKYIDEGSAVGRAQVITKKLLNCIQESANGFKSGMSIYWTEDTT